MAFIDSLPLQRGMLQQSVLLHAVPLNETNATFTEFYKKVGLLGNPRGFTKQLDFACVLQDAVTLNFKHGCACNEVNRILYSIISADGVPVLFRMDEKALKSLLRSYAPLLLICSWQEHMQLINVQLARLNNPQVNLNTIATYVNALKETIEKAATSKRAAAKADIDFESLLALNYMYANTLMVVQRVKRGGGSTESALYTRSRDILLAMAHAGLIDDGTHATAPERIRFATQELVPSMLTALYATGMDASLLGPKTQKAYDTGTLAAIALVPNKPYGDAVETFNIKVPQSSLKVMTDEVSSIPLDMMYSFSEGFLQRISTGSAVYEIVSQGKVATESNKHYVTGCGQNYAAILNAFVPSDMQPLVIKHANENAGFTYRNCVINTYNIRGSLQTTSTLMSVDPFAVLNIQPVDPKTLNLDAVSVAPAAVYAEFRSVVMSRRTQNAQLKYLKLFPDIKEALKTMDLTALGEEPLPVTMVQTLITKVSYRDVYSVIKQFVDGDKWPNKDAMERIKKASALPTFAPYTFSGNTVAERKAELLALVRKNIVTIQYSLGIVQAEFVVTTNEALLKNFIGDDYKAAFDLDKPKDPNQPEKVSVNDQPENPGITVCNVRADRVSALYKTLLVPNITAVYCMK